MPPQSNECHVHEHQSRDDFPRIGQLSTSTALLIVDVQPEFWSGSPHVRKDFPDFPMKLQKTIDLCRLHKIKIIWVRTDCTKGPIARLDQIDDKKQCLPLSEIGHRPHDWEWEDFANPQWGDIVVIKEKSWAGINRTGLLSFLQEQTNIDTILVCGVFTSMSVHNSAFSVFEAGYRTMLVEDACADRGRARHYTALDLYGNYMYEVLASRDLEIESKNIESEQYRFSNYGAFSTTHDGSSVHKQSQNEDITDVNSSMNMLTQVSSGA